MAPYNVPANVFDVLVRYEHHAEEKPVISTLAGIFRCTPKTISSKLSKAHEEFKDPCIRLNMEQTVYNQLDHYAIALPNRLNVFHLALSIGVTKRTIYNRMNFMRPEKEKDISPISPTDSISSTDTQGSMTAALKRTSLKNRRKSEPGKQRMIKSSDAIAAKLEDSISPIKVKQEQSDNNADADFKPVTNTKTASKRKRHGPAATSIKAENDDDDLDFAKESRKTTNERNKRAKRAADTSPASENNDSGSAAASPPRKPTPPPLKRVRNTSSLAREFAVSNAASEPTDPEQSDTQHPDPAQQLALHQAAQHDTSVCSPPNFIAKTHLTPEKHTFLWRHTQQPNAFYDAAIAAESAHESTAGSATPEFDVVVEVVQQPELVFTEEEIAFLEAGNGAAKVATSYDDNTITHPTFPMSQDADFDVEEEKVPLTSTFFNWPENVFQHPAPSVENTAAYMHYEGMTPDVEMSFATSDDCSEEVSSLANSHSSSFGDNHGEHYQGALLQHPTAAIDPFGNQQMQTQTTSPTIPFPDYNYDYDYEDPYTPQLKLENPYGYERQPDIRMHQYNPYSPSYDIGAPHNSRQVYLVPCTCNNCIQAAEIEGWCPAHASDGGYMRMEREDDDHWPVAHDGPSTWW